MSNSGRASEVFDALGLGPEKYAQLVVEAAGAKKVIFAKDGTEVTTVPDMYTRSWAAEQIRDVHGFKFVPEQKTDVNVAFVQIVQDVKQKSLQELEQEASRFLPVNRLPDAKKV